LDIAVKLVGGRGGREAMIGQRAWQCEKAKVFEKCAILGKSVCFERDGSAFSSESRCCHRCVFRLFAAISEDAVADFPGHLSEEQPEVGSFAVIGGGDVFHAVGVSRELVAFAE